MGSTMANWHVAQSLNTLLAQLNALAPKRSKASDGSVGDAQHATRTSDHNPWFKNTVTARDFTHDPKNGLDCNKLAEALVKARDPRVKYIIWNRRIIDSRPGNRPWQWMPYSGTNPHTQHLHLSVMNNASCESSASWSLPGLASSKEYDMAAVPQDQWAKVFRQVSAAFDFRKHHGAQTDDQFGHVMSIRKELAELAKKVDELAARLDDKPCSSA